MKMRNRNPRRACALTWSSSSSTWSSSSSSSSRWSVTIRQLLALLVVVMTMTLTMKTTTTSITPTMSWSFDYNNNNNNNNHVNNDSKMEEMKSLLKLWWFPLSTSINLLLQQQQQQQHLRRHGRDGHSSMVVDKDDDDDDDKAAAVVSTVVETTSRAATTETEIATTLTTTDTTANTDTTLFPTAWEVLEMAKLSRLVYTLKGQTECNATKMKPLGLECHYYKHDINKGTQVLIVSSSKSSKPRTTTITTTTTTRSSSFLPRPSNRHRLSSLSSSLLQRDDNIDNNIDNNDVDVDYVAVVFCGTDDLRTSLADGDIIMKPFGPLMSSDAHVHAGFANNVQDIQDDVLDIVRSVIQNMTTTTTTTTTTRVPRLYTTGHSLGAADAVLVSTYMALKDPDFIMQHVIQSITFGCPKIGNAEFRTAVHSILREKHRLQLWRFVLGWDLVPRLPAYPFIHVGHTVQMTPSNKKMKKIMIMTQKSTMLSSSSSSSLSNNHDDYQHNNHDDYDDLDENHDYDVQHNNPVESMRKRKSKKDDSNNNNDDDDDDNAAAIAYYHHTGNETLMYAGVPFGWGTTSFVWIPGALYAHRMIHYLEHIHDIVVLPLNNHTHPSSSLLNITHFEPTNHSKHHTQYYDDDDDIPIIPPTIYP